MSQEQKTLEEHLKDIEMIINQMEASDLALETSFQLYQQGVEQLKMCHQLLDEVEKKMLILNQNGEMSEF